MSTTNPSLDRETRRAGVIIGALVLLQMIGGALVNFGLLAPAFAEPGFLVNAAAHALQVRLAVLLGLVTGALSLAIAITAFPMFRQHSQAMALWFVALAAVSLAMVAIENISLMSMLSLSQTYVSGSEADRAQLQALQVLVRWTRNWSHYIGLIVAGATLFVFYSVLYRFALVPRALALFGLAAVGLQINAVSMPLFGYGVVFPLLAPLGVCQLILAFWLFFKGFAVRTVIEEESDGQPPSKPPPFSAIAKEVFREQLPDAKATKSEWTGKSNIAWCVVDLDERFVGYFIVQRTHGVRMTGELAFSQGVHVPALFGAIQQKQEPFGCRERIGKLVGKGDTWWPCSREADALKQELGEMVKLMTEHSSAFFEKCKAHARQHAET